MAGDGKGPFRGTLEVFTGGGKTLIALAAYARVLELQPQARLAVVVPTEALVAQWIETIVKRTTIERSEVGRLGGGETQSFQDHRVLIAVINTASKKLPALAESVDHLMLVVDECHRAGSPGFSKVLDTRAVYRMGLSATPARDEVDEAGFQLSFDEQLVGRSLGDIVFRFGLKDARLAGWLPRYTVHHHAVRLNEKERLEYERLSRKVTDAADSLSSAGGQVSQAWKLAIRRGENAPLAQAYVGAVAARKGFLYGIEGRQRVACQIVSQCLENRARPRILLFHERVAEAGGLAAALRAAFPEEPIALEHSELPAKARREALGSFRTGKSNVLVSVKSLVEGIDVPDADIGVSVASSSSVRQRIQTLGRVLRRRFDGEEKVAEMHVLYAHDTVDESIYGKEDWSDLTGADANRYWLWPLDPAEGPAPLEGPPQTPLPTEEDAWQQLGERIPDPPAPWPAIVPENEFSVDTRGNVTTADGRWIENPQDVASMVDRVRGRPGGRFRVTSVYNLVIVYGAGTERQEPFLAGRLTAPFRIRDVAESLNAAPDVAALQPGSPYPGPANSERGSFKLRQKQGGVIERKAGTVTEFAETEGSDPQSLSGARVVEAWKSLGIPGLTFYVNNLGHAWYRQSGQPLFLAEASDGFRWPTPVSGDIVAP